MNQSHIELIELLIYENLDLAESVSGKMHMECVQRDSRLREIKAFLEEEIDLRVTKKNIENNYEKH